MVAKWATTDRNWWEASMQQLTAERKKACLVWTGLIVWTSINKHRSPFIRKRTAFRSGGHFRNSFLFVFLTGDYLMYHHLWLLRERIEALLVATESQWQYMYLVFLLADYCPLERIVSFSRYQYKHLNKSKSPPPNIFKTTVWIFMTFLVSNYMRIRTKISKLLCNRIGHTWVNSCDTC